MDAGTPTIFAVRWSGAGATVGGNSAAARLSGAAMTGFAGAAKAAGAMIAFASAEDSAGNEGIEDCVKDRRSEDANTAEDTATRLASGGGSGNSGMESGKKIR